MDDSKHGGQTYPEMLKNVGSGVADGQNYPVVADKA